jgi:predicted dithiol-disulfide oxidoreductase (DUF899 family)
MRMSARESLVPVAELVKRNDASFPNEGTGYRQARNALLAEELELRRHIERVAEQRRQLPPGGEVRKDYRFDGEHGRVSLRDLFGDKDTLVIYSYMFGPQRQKPCPMCTSLLAAWEGNAPNIEQRAALAIVARSPIEKILAAKRAFGWTHLKMYSDGEGDFTRDYVSATDEDTSRYTVFRRDGDVIRHFWSDEIGDGMADPGQDPRGAPDPDPLWSLLDNTPEGRGTTWRPQLILKSAL